MQRYPSSLERISVLHAVNIQKQPVKKQLVQKQVKENSPTLLTQAGKEHYQKQQFTAAVTKWQHARKILISRGDTLNEAMVLGNLAQAYQQLGKLAEAKNATAKSIELLSSHQKDNQNLFAATLNIQGSLLLSEGNIEDAIAVWKRAVTIYEKTGDENGLTRCLLNQTQAYNRLGMHQRALNTLKEVNKTLQNQPDSPLKIVSLLHLGDTLRLTGNIGDSKKTLEQSLAIAEKLNSEANISKILLALGNTYSFEEKNHKALKFYQQAIDKSKSAAIKLQAQLNTLRLLVDTQNSSKAIYLASKIKPQLQNLTPSRTSVYALVNYVKSIEELNISEVSNKQENVKILAKAVQQAENIGDERAQSYALGYLGHLYEQTQQFNSARSLTEKALILAKISNASDITYRWEWQLGRLLTKQHNFVEAIAAYDNAVTTLGSIRNDLVASNLDMQFSFRESVEPIYREFVSLLLTPELEETSQENLKKARQVIESLQLAELDNFFNEPCLKVSPTQVDQIDKQAAVIYPIILENRLETVVSLPNQPLRHYTTAISENEVEKMVQTMRRAIRRKFLKKQHFAICQKIYNLIIKPLEADLAASKIQTLAFVLDGSLKNVPMAALYDGKQYLLEKYNIALSPGMQLLDPQPLENQKMEVLVGALSEGRQGFVPLPGVKTEIDKINSEISTEVLFNQKFTSQALQKQISKTPFPIVHLATHGEFSSKAEDTFVLTWDNRLDVKELGDILHTREQLSSKPIELLVLSACKTASGDKRAPLGLAGVAVRSGARSTIASLWSVDDESTSQMMVDFYEHLRQPRVTKAEALRHAQLKILGKSKFKHPYYWSAFVLVGNWL
ncbi:CHAT domain-containing protein [Mastigocoleus testarum]|uniref:CHAT domain-containing protein n=1 Tax=Mastigocoleus testarum TaxID=996925 RepID=UPI001F456118|nr:CHAT domain-containing protein [Mastigocoleus testarum]